MNWEKKTHFSFIMTFVETIFSLGLSVRSTFFKNKHRGVHKMRLLNHHSLYHFYGWMDRRTDGWTNRQTDGQTDRQTDRRTQPLIEMCSRILKNGHYAKLQPVCVITFFDHFGHFCAPHLRPHDPFTCVSKIHIVDSNHFTVSITVA